MTRLVHSRKAWIRSLQISEARIFIFVEGGLDRVVADKAAEAFGPDFYRKSQVRSIKELFGTGGKAEVIKCFKYLRRAGMLKASHFGKNLYSVFMLDKDVDDLRRKQLRSEHVIYTTSYDLEGQLFLASDAAPALAEACLVTKEVASRWMPSAMRFSSDVAEVWADWVALCGLSSKCLVNCGCTYDRYSAVNVPDGLSASSQDLVDQFVSDVSDRRGVTIASTLMDFQKIRSKHMKFIRDGQPLSLFKGKWLAGLLELHVKRQEHVADSNVNSVFERVLVSIVGKINSENLDIYLPRLSERLRVAQLYVA